MIDAAIMIGLGFLLICLAGMVAIITFVYSYDKREKSRSYRKLLVDMYVVGKIRQFASKDNISLAEELKLFKKLEKEKKVDWEALDTTIERELQDKIEEEKEEDKTYLDLTEKK